MDRLRGQKGLLDFHSASSGAVNTYMLTLSHLNMQRKRDLPVSAAMMDLGDERHFVCNIGPSRALAPSLWAERARLNT